MSDEKQINIRVSEEEFSAIKKGAEAKGLTVKDLFLESLRRFSSDENQSSKSSKSQTPQETALSLTNDAVVEEQESDSKEDIESEDKEEDSLQDEESSLNPCKEVEECIRKSETLTGFSMEKLSNSLQTHGLSSKDLSSEDIEAILYRYYQHAKYWNHSDEAIVSNLEMLSKAIEEDSKTIRRRYFEMIEDLRS